MPLLTVSNTTTVEVVPSCIPTALYEVGKMGMMSEHKASL
jgi:hypothetical protein